METTEKPIDKEQVKQWVKNDIGAALALLEVIWSDPILLDLAAERLLEYKEKVEKFAKADDPNGAGNS